MYKYLWILFICTPLLANPWGKDADLALKRPASSSVSPPPSFLARLGDQAVRFHQEVISPADGPRSHFIPSSSQYTRDAIHKYGFFSGVMMGCDRLMRENSDPWVYKKVTDLNGYSMKWDPVK